MVGWLTRWFEPTAAKAPRSATLTQLLGTKPAGSLSTLDGLSAPAHNRGWVFASIRVVASRIAGQPVRVGRRAGRRSPTKGSKAASSPPWVRPGSVTELDDHDLLDAFADPNPFLTQWGLVYLLVASLELTGTAYLWLDEQPDGSTRIWFLPSGWVVEDPDSPEPLSRWLVRPANSGEEFTLTRDELIRFTLPDPGNPLNGLGPMQAAGASVLCDEYIQVAQTQAFRNGLLPGLAIKVGKPFELAGIGGDAPTLNKEQRQSLTDAVKRLHGGPGNAGEPMILDGIIEEVKAITTAPREMDFGGSGSITKGRITQAFGVNPIVMGEVEGANRASATVADEHLCFTTCGPLCVLVGQTLTKWFRVHYEDDGLVVWIDPPRPRDPDGKRADLDQLIRGGGITVNELRAEHGLPAMDGGDVPVKPAAVPVASRN